MIFIDSNSKCDKCIKNDVCSKKDIFKKVEEAVKNCTIGFGDNSFIEIRNINEIDVSFVCKHFRQDNGNIR